MQELEKKANNFQSVYSKDIGADLTQELLSFRREFKSEISAIQTVRKLFKLIVDTNMATSVPEVTAACALFLTLPVTVASTER